jgi:GNAT superfamily N-acetyltransferase
MSDVERCVQASLITFAVEDAASTDARWCIERYFAELHDRFEGGFNPDLTIPADVQELSPPAGLLILARLRDQPVGCGAIKFQPGQIADVKRMWVSPSVRGLGVGRRLLARLEDEAHAAGAVIARLETNRALGEAISLYRHAGYREVAPFNDETYAHHWFEKRLR